MKRIHLLGAVALASVSMLLASCGDSEPKPITAKAIVKEANKQLIADAESEVYTEVKVGTYESYSYSERQTLAQLEVAGIINYEVTRYAWWEKSLKSYRKAYKVTRGYGWWSYEDTEYKTVKGTSYDFEDHYVVSVSLTKKGERLAVAELPEPAVVVDKDLVSKEINPDNYKWNKVDLSENWEDIPNPFLDPKEPEAPAPEEPKTPKAPKGPKDPESPKTTNKTEKNPTVRIDSLKYEAYNNLVLESEIKYLKAGEVKAIKARNIQILNDNGALTATAEVIYETTDATDAGRILIGYEDGQRNAKDAEFVYYYDKGWVLKDK